MSIAYDSDNLDDIPTEAEIYAYYNDGEPGTATPFQLARHPGKGYSISRLRGVASYWKDVENGAATIQDFIDDFKAGLCHGIYIQWSRVASEFIPAAMTAGISGYDLWSAHWGATQLDPGAVWTQYQSPSSNPPTSGHFDLSYVYSAWVPKGEQMTNTSNTGVEAASGKEALAAPVVAAAATPSGNGYYLFGADGGVFCFGDAQPHNDGEGKSNLSGVTLAKPIVAAFVSRSGAGYTMVAADGGVFCFGDAAFHGSV